MSLLSLLTEPVSILKRTPGATDDYGNGGDVFTTSSSVRGRMEQRSSEERTQDRQTVISDWVLYLAPTVVVAEQDRVSDRFGRIFEVVGAPAMNASPSRDVYVEVSLRHVDG